MLPFLHAQTDTAAPSSIPFLHVLMAERREQVFAEIRDRISAGATDDFWTGGGAGSSLDYDRLSEFSYLHPKCLAFDNSQPFADLNLDDQFGPSTYSQSPHTLALGDSTAAGSGIRREYTWPQLGAWKLGVTVNTVSKPGCSIDYLLPRAVAMIEQFGKPEQVVAVLPPLARAWLPMRKKSDDGSPVTIADAMIYAPMVKAYVTAKDMFTFLIQRTRDKDLKYDRAAIRVPPEISVWYQTQALHIFTSLCRSWGVPCRLASYHKGTMSALIDSFDIIIPTHYQYDHNADWRSDGHYGHSADSCHEPQTAEQARLWHEGDDDMPHRGLHYQIHYAETAFGMTITNDDLTTLL